MANAVFAQSPDSTDIVRAIRCASIEDLVLLAASMQGPSTFNEFRCSILSSIAVTQQRIHTYTSYSNTDEYKVSF